MSFLGPLYSLFHLFLTQNTVLLQTLAVLNGSFVGTRARPFRVSTCKCLRYPMQCSGNPNISCFLVHSSFSMRLATLHGWQCNFRVPSSVHARYDFVCQRCSMSHLGVYPPLGCTCSPYGPSWTPRPPLGEVRRKISSQIGPLGLRRPSF